MSMFRPKCRKLWKIIIACQGHPSPKFMKQTFPVPPFNLPPPFSVPYSFRSPPLPFPPLPSLAFVPFHPPLILFPHSSLSSTLSHPMHLVGARVQILPIQPSWGFSFGQLNFMKCQESGPSFWLTSCIRACTGTSYSSHLIFTEESMPRLNNIDFVMLAVGSCKIWKLYSKLNLQNTIHLWLDLVSYNLYGSLHLAIFIFIST